MNDYDLTSEANDGNVALKSQKDHRALLVYPQFPEHCFWNSYLVNKKLYPTNSDGYPKAAMPPLGLLCIVDILEEEYGVGNVKLVDMNTNPLKQEDLEWATEIYLSAMLTQSKSFDEVALIAKTMGKTTIGGGPYVSEDTPNLDYIFINEAEKTLKPFLRDFFSKNAPVKVQIGEKPSNDDFFRPNYEWIDVNNYAALSIQFSRGCPHDCEFCDITQRYGRKMRTKNIDIFLEELEWMYKTGWRGDVFVIDDNFIGKPKDALNLLKEIAIWQKKHSYPFRFYTQATVLLAEERFEELLKAFYPAGFYMIFLGIETPSEMSLKETNKMHNIRGNVSLAEKIKKIQKVGKVLILGGFIVGFDSDDESIFARQEQFINEEIKIPMPFINMLDPLPYTHLDTRLKKEGRLLVKPLEKLTNTINVNFSPKGMDSETLKKGYVGLLKSVYLNKQKFYSRCEFAIKFLGRPLFKESINKEVVIAVCNLILYLGIFNKGIWYFWKFIFKTLFKTPSKVFIAFRLAGYGLHYEILTNIRVRDFKSQKTGYHGFNHITNNIRVRDFKSQKTVV